jgi:hypothetical protein
MINYGRKKFSNFGPSLNCFVPVSLVRRAQRPDRHQERGRRPVQHHRLRRRLALPWNPGKGRG